MDKEIDDNKIAKHFKYREYVLEWFDLPTTGFQPLNVFAKSLLIQSDTLINVGIDSSSNCLHNITHIKLNYPVQTLYLQRSTISGVNGRVLVTAFFYDDLFEPYYRNGYDRLNRMQNIDLTWNLGVGFKEQDFDLTAHCIRHIHFVNISWERTAGTVTRITIYEGNANHTFSDIYLNTPAGTGNFVYDPPVTCFFNNFGEPIPAVTVRFYGSVQGANTTLYAKFNYKYD